MNMLVVANEATNVTAMWYDNSVLMTFLGVIVGGVIGFVGSIIQSRIAAKNNIDVIKNQFDNEIEQHRYMEKEKLYSELIGFVPQFSLSVDVSSNKLSLSREQKIQLNSFKARLAIFANQQIYDEFYDLIIFITEEPDNKKAVSRMNAFTDMLLADLKQTTQDSK
ncbi:MAG: hypothetical protein SPI93_07390 [Oscillospiraceae bacterium]|nr:hypothetical protein [Oscillospiraceae bacterium]